MYKLLILVTMLSLTGCASLTEGALQYFEPEQRAEYRDGLEQATEAYDTIYDRDGHEIRE